MDDGKVACVYSLNTGTFTGVTAKVDRRSGPHNKRYYASVCYAASQNSLFTIKLENVNKERKACTFRLLRLKNFGLKPAYDPELGKLPPPVQLAASLERVRAEGSVLPPGGWAALLSISPRCSPCPTPYALSFSSVVPVPVFIEILRSCRSQGSPSVLLVVAPLFGSAACTP